jgi:signal transduction histidine kinase
MRRFSTLRGRLTAVALAVTAVAVVVLLLAFNLILASSLDGHASSRLRSQAAAAATTVDAEGHKLAVRESPNDGAVDAHVWVFEGKQPVVRPAAVPAVQAAAGKLAGGPRGFAEVEPADVRLFALPIVNDHIRVGTVIAAVSLDPIEHTTDVALLASLVLAVVLLSAVFAVTWLTIGRALDPVTAMTRSAAEWGEHDRDRRFGAAPRPGELGELAATFDALLDRVAASLRREQRLSAELSHELRTPLSRVTAEIELLQRRERSLGERAQAHDAVARSAEQMSRILETLMASARADAQLDRGRSDIGETFDRLAEAWAEPLAGRGVALDATAGGQPAVVVGLDTDLVERIVAPLLDNAGRYARSRVTLRASRAEGRVEVSVIDDGPGLANADLERVFEPGAHGSRANGHAGTGLGLALSRRLARAVGGDVRATARAGGGAEFVVDLPA